MIRLYSLVAYDRGAKARWMLTEMGVAFEEKRLNREAKEHEGPVFLKLNPMGRVPVLEIGDTVIFESGAICAYLADLYPTHPMAPALTSPARAKYLQWMFFASSTLDSFQTRIMIIEDIPAGELRTTKETALLSELRDAMGTLDQTLAHSPYLVAGAFSAADIAVSYPIYFCMLWPELAVVIQEFPRVVAYLDRLKQMPSAVKSGVFSYQG